MPQDEQGMRKTFHQLSMWVAHNLVQELKKIVDWKTTKKCKLCNF